jgi:hypothetical protein
MKQVNLTSPAIFHSIFVLALFRLRPGIQSFTMVFADHTEAKGKN